MAEDYMAMYRDALQRLSTGGMSLEASLQEIEEGKKQAIGRGQQALVSGGLGGATIMGGVPIQAEKIAARQRLGARGRAEEKYLTTLASYATFAQRGQEAATEREAAMKRLQAQIEAQKEAAAVSAQPGILAAMKMGGGASAGGGGAGGGGYAQQFPSLYDRGGAEVPAPDWIGGGAGSGVMHQATPGYGLGEWAQGPGGEADPYAETLSKLRSGRAHIAGMSQEEAIRSIIAKQAAARAKWGLGNLSAGSSNWAGMNIAQSGMGGFA